MERVIFKDTTYSIYREGITSLPNGIYDIIRADIYGCIYHTVNAMENGKWAVTVNDGSYIIMYRKHQMP